MTKLSKWKVDPEKMALFLDDFWSAIASLESKQEAKNFFYQFLTHTERKMFAKRFQIAMMLLSGYDYAAIKNRIQVSEATIAKISNWLEGNGETLIEIAKRILSLKIKKGESLEGVRQSGHMKGDLASSVMSEITNVALRSIARRKKRLSIK